MHRRTNGDQAATRERIIGDAAADLLIPSLRNASNTAAFCSVAKREHYLKTFKSGRFQTCHMGNTPLDDAQMYVGAVLSQS